MASKGFIEKMITRCMLAFYADNINEAFKVVEPIHASPYMDHEPLFIRLSSLNKDPWQRIHPSRIDAWEIILSNAHRKEKRFRSIRIRRDVIETHNGKIQVCDPDMIRKTFEALKGWR